MSAPVSLTHKTTRGIFWSFLDLIANHGIQFLIQVILARILLPEYFGVIGILMVFIAISNSVVDSGFSQALIRDKETSQEDYSTVFYYNLATSIAVYGILFFLSGPISTFFHIPQLMELIKVISLVIILSSLGITQRVMLVKRIDFRTITKISFISSSASGVITIAAALLGFGIWSFVINSISLQLFQTILLVFYNRWIPSLTFNLQSFKRFFGFGSKLLLSGIIDTLYNNAYFIIIGKLFSAQHLGYYTNTVKLRDMASQSIASTVQRVTYPVLSSIQDDEMRLKDGFRKVIRISAYLNFPLMIGMAAIADPLFMILFGEEWMEAVIYFQLLCVAGMLYPLHALNLNILQVKGRSDLFLIVEIIKKVSLTVLIVLSIVLELGMIGLICAAAINSFISLFLNMYFSAKIIGYTTKEQLKDLFTMFISSIAMGGLVLFLGTLIHELYMKFFAQIIVGIILYIAISKVFKLREFNQLIDMIVPVISKKT